MHTRQRDISRAVAGKPTTTMAMWRCNSKQQQQQQERHEQEEKQSTYAERNTMRSAHNLQEARL